MKIVHICLSGPYSDGYSYQENMLARFHKKSGYEVDIITSVLHLDDDGICSEFDSGSRYVDDHGVR